MLGRDEMIYRQLESHKIDEMLIISPSIAPIFQDHESYDLERLLNIYVGVPVGVAGQTGLSQLCHLAELGCIERFCFSGKLHHDRSPELQFVMRNCGRQAIVGLLVRADLAVHHRAERVHHAQREDEARRGRHRLVVVDQRRATLGDLARLRRRDEPFVHRKLNAHLIQLELRLRLEIRT